MDAQDGQLRILCDSKGRARPDAQRVDITLRALPDSWITLLQEPGLPALLTTLLWLTSNASAGTRPALVDGWLVDQWSSADGLPLDHATDTARTPDGTVWIATFDGLVRFDGDTFHTLGPDELPGMRTNRIAHLAVHPDDGALWILTDQGRAVGRLLDGDFKVWEDLPARPHILQHDEEGLWLGTDDGLYRLDQHPERWRPEQVRGSVAGTVLSPDGSRWVATPDGMLRFRGEGAPTLFGPESGVPQDVAFVVADADGWPALLPTELEAHRWTGDRFAPAPLGFRRVDQHLLGPAALDLGGGWGMSPEGVTVHGQLIEPWTGRTFSASVHPDGSLWLATASAGVLRVRRSPLRTLRSGEVDEQVRTMHLDDAGRLWLVGWWRWWTWTERGAQPLVEQEIGPSYLISHQGRLLVASDRLLELRSGPEGSSLVPIEGPRLGQVFSTHESRDGDLLLGDSEALWSWDGRAWTELMGPGGQPLDQVRRMVEHPEGGLLLARVGGGLHWLRGDGSLARYEDAGGRNTDNIRDVRVDGSWLWVGSEDLGLCAVPIEGLEADWRCIGLQNGLPAPGAHLSLVDERDRVWVSTNRGLAVGRQAQLRAFADGDLDRLDLLHLDTRHGMLSSEGNGGFDGCAVRDLDGTLWFATQRGAVGVDPIDFELPSAPAVRVGVARLGQEILGDLPIPTEHEALALGLELPESVWSDQVVFRHRLDRGPWSDPEDSRTLRFEVLPPGAFTVEVQAGLAGQWGPVASWSGERQPRLSEHRAFPLVVLGGLLTVVLGSLGVWELRRRARVRDLEEEVGRRTAELGESNAALAQHGERLAEQARRLEQLDVLRTRMLVNLHHELRTPVSLVAGPLESLRGEQGLSERGRGSMELALRNADALERLLDQLFDIARLEACELPIHPCYADVVGLARRVTARMEALARQREVVLAGPEDGEAAAWCDVDLVDKVVSNLVHNALKFSSEGGQVRVDVSSQGEEVLVEVLDQGPGVPESARDHIFHRLYQLDGTDGQGSGVGLALAREIVALHGGQIGVSAGPGGSGSRFWFRLPASDAPLSTAGLGATKEAPRAALPEPEASEDAPRVLVVDDHPDLRAFLYTQLADTWQVQVAADGLEALACIEEEAPDLVISDIMMPRMDGLELARRLRRDWPSVALLLLSAKASAEDRVSGLVLADDYLPKPFRVAELRARVSALLRRSQGGVAEEPRPERSGADQALLDRLQAVADARMKEEGFGATALASAMAMSPRNFRREMRRVTDLSPTEWLRERRLRRAHDLLRDGTYRTVSEVAAAVGLSRSYFSRTYAAWAGQAAVDVLPD